MGYLHDGVTMTGGGVPSGRGDYERGGVPSGRGRSPHRSASGSGSRGCLSPKPDGPVHQSRRRRTPHSPETRLS